MTDVAPAKLRVRPAEGRDLERIHAIERASFADPWTLDGFRDVLAQPRALVAVADDDDGKLLGYAVAWFVDDQSEIANLAVAPAERRRGIGTLLLARILEEAAAQRVRHIVLEVRESNIAAQQLYARRGFTVAGRRVQYYRRPVEDALIMRKEL